MSKRPANLQAIQESFGIQASGFESPSMSFSQKEYLGRIVAALLPGAGDSVLEIAAGTCACGRALAPAARTVVCLDATPAMLQVGRDNAREEGLGNMVFVKGYAEDLPFLDDSFDIVISRLAFHHFADTLCPFEEMARVTRPGGKLAVIDLEAAEEALRATEDGIEALRDPSHVRNLSQEEILGLFASRSFAIERRERTEMSVSLDAWMRLTKTPDTVRGEIEERMRAEIDGCGKTGFSPYPTADGVFFRQRWQLAVGRKPAEG